VTLPSEESHPADDEARFAALYDASFHAIYSYVLRRVGPTEVRDVVQEVYTTAWRTAKAIPKPPEDRLWLFGVAQRTIQHSHRGLLRRSRLQDRLERTELPPVEESPADPLNARLESAIAHLRARDRELLRLILWDELDRADVAHLLGCSVNAVDIRYHRAVSRLRDGLATAKPAVEPRTSPEPATGS
jgi:RNA polymerase sigma-70 factor (ECF subfamily)